MAALWTAYRFIEVREAVGVDPKAATDGPCQRAPANRRQSHMAQFYRARELADPYKYERKDGQHVSHMVIEPCLGAHQRQYHRRRSQEHQLISERSTVPARTHGRSRRQNKHGPRPKRHLDEQRVKVVVPPASMPPFTVQVRPHPRLELRPLRVEALEIVPWKRNGDLRKPGAGESVVASCARGSRRRRRLPRAHEATTLSLIHI